MCVGQSLGSGPTWKRRGSTFTRLPPGRLELPRTDDARNVLAGLGAVRPRAQGSYGDRERGPWCRLTGVGPRQWQHGAACTPRWRRAQPCPPTARHAREVSRWAGTVECGVPEFGGRALGGGVRVGLGLCTVGGRLWGQSIKPGSPAGSLVPKWTGKALAAFPSFPPRPMSPPGSPLLPLDP